MKIAYDAKRFFHNRSGLGNYSRDLIRILNEYLPSFRLLLLAKKTSDLGESLLKNPSIQFLTIGKSKLARLRTMGKIAQNENADIFHGLSGELPLRWSSKPIKKIVTIHDLIFVRYPEYYSFFDRKIHFWKFKKAAQQSDIIIAISQQTRRDIIEFLKIPESKIRLVYQGCHKAFKKKYSEEQKQKIREKWQLPPRFVLNVGSVEERKNLLNVVKALHNSEIPLVVVGKKTNYWKKIENYRTQSKDTNQLKHLENVGMEDLAILYQMADVFVYPSRFEGFGIPIIEALFSKTPVITGCNSCLPEAAGPYSFYVDVENPEDLSSKIRFLWDNPSERQNRAEKSYEFVQKFNDEEIAQNLMKVYEEVLASK